MKIAMLTHGSMPCGCGRAKTVRFVARPNLKTPEKSDFSVSFTCDECGTELSIPTSKIEYVYLPESEPWPFHKEKKTPEGQPVP